MRLSNIITDLYEQANPSDAEFWKTVKEAKWTSDHNYNRIKVQWMRKLTPPKSEGMRRTFSKFSKKLDAKISDQVEGVGDDGYSDVLAHIVGAGKTFYDSVMKDPSLAQRLIDNDQYKESFAYAFPSKEDYREIDPHDLSFRAERTLERLQVFIGPRSPIKKEEHARVMHDMVKRLRLAADQNFRKAIAGWDKEKYSAWGELVQKFRKYDSNLNYGASNLLNDLENFSKG